MSKASDTTINSRLSEPDTISECVKSDYIKLAMTYLHHPLFCDKYTY